MYVFKVQFIQEWTDDTGETGTELDRRHVAAQDAEEAIHLCREAESGVESEWEDDDGAARKTVYNFQKLIAVEKVCDIDIPD